VEEAKMRRTRLFWLLVACVALALAPAPAGAQVSLFPRQGLSFGTLSPGVPEWIAPTDVARRAEVELVGSGDYTVLVEVPAALVSAAGSSMPISFGVADGMIRWRKSTQEQVFRPGQSVEIRIPAGIGGAYVWIGGTAQPTTSQRPGHYAGAITVRIMAAGT
jgi:hypothetical protein